jgi:hypothetical protein
MPNPNSGEFVVELSSGLIKNVTVYDLMGRQILQKVTDNDRIFVDITSFASGIYYVKVQTETNFKVIKVVKQ